MSASGENWSTECQLGGRCVSFAGEPSVKLFSLDDSLRLSTIPWQCVAGKVGATGAAAQKESTIPNAGDVDRFSVQLPSLLGQLLRHGWSDQGRLRRTWRDYHNLSKTSAGRAFQEDAARRRVRAEIWQETRSKERFCEWVRLAVSGGVVLTDLMHIPHRIAGLSPHVRVAKLPRRSVFQKTETHATSTLPSRIVGFRHVQPHATKEVQAIHFWARLCGARQEGKCPQTMERPEVFGEIRSTPPWLARRVLHCRKLNDTSSGLRCSIEDPLCCCADARGPNGRCALRSQLEPSHRRFGEAPCGNWPRHSIEKARMIRERYLRMQLDSSLADGRSPCENLPGF